MAESALLRCLSQLNEDTWATVLLPKLIHNGSAAEVALTCTQLRDLCYSGVRELNLASLSSTDDISKVEDWTAALHAHFANCNIVRLCVAKDTDFHITPYLLPALARLPNLNSIDLAVQQDELSPAAMSATLCSLRTQLSRLQALTLHLDQSWAGASSTWRELGRITQLTSLGISFDTDVELPCLGADLLQLSQLDSLASISIEASGSIQAMGELMAPGWLNRLTALTSLRCEEVSVDQLCAVRECVALQDLFLHCCNVDPSSELGPAEWATLAALTQLTRLFLWNSTQHTPSKARSSTLQCLKRLQEFAAASLSADVLPDLVGCTQLTSIRGAWLPTDNPCFSRLPYVLHLGWVAGPVPYSAFPNLKSLYVDVSDRGPITSAALRSLTRHCASLEEFAVNQANPTSCTLPPAELSTVRAAAICSMVSLTQLTSMEFVVHDNAELAALVSAVTALVNCKLKSFRLVLQQSGDATIAGLMQLARVSSLQCMSVKVPSRMVFAVDDARMFVAVFGGMQDVWIEVTSEQQQTVLTAAVEWLSEHAFAGRQSIRVV